MKRPVYRGKSWAGFWTQTVGRSCWLAGNKFQTERAHTCMHLLTLARSHSPTHMHACTHTQCFVGRNLKLHILLRTDTPLYFYRFWRNYVVFVQILKEPCSVCTDSEGECTCMSDPCPLHRPAGEQRCVLLSASSFSSSALIFGVFSPCQFFPAIWSCGCRN